MVGNGAAEDSRESERGRLTEETRSLCLDIHNFNHQPRCKVVSENYTRTYPVTWNRQCSVNRRNDWDLLAPLPLLQWRDGWRNSSGI
ncbi:hypothetical protein GN956_G3823 [Arapaima gigas]